jgi:capsular exopolysaccharide synthesis family protein
MASNDIVISSLAGQPGDSGGGHLQRYTPPPGMSQEPEDGESVNWGRYIAALRRHGWLMGIVVLLGTGAGIVATRFMEPTYTATATIWVNNGPARLAEGPIQAPQLLTADNWLDLLRSSVVLDSVVIRRRMVMTYDKPADSLVFSDFSVGDRYAAGKFILSVSADGEGWTLRQADHDILHGTTGAPIGAALGWTWAPAKNALGRNREIDFTVRPAREVSTSLNTRMIATLPEGGTFIRVSLDGTNRSTVAPVLNDICRQFVTVAADLKRRNLRDYRMALDSQVSRAYASLREAEARFQQFQINTITQPRNGVLTVAPGLTATQPQATTQYFTEKTQLDLIRADRRQLEAVVERAKQGGFVADAFLTIGAVKGAPQLGAALADLSKAEGDYATNGRRYTAEHPIMTQLAAQIQQLRTVRIPALAQALIDQLRAQESDLERRIQSEGAELRSVPTVTINESRLQRELDAANELYKMLASRFEEAKLAELGSAPDIHVLEEAVTPTRPSRNTAPKIIMLAMVASIGLAVGLALMLDQMDRRFRYPEQVTNELGLTILGAVPACKKNRAGEIAPEEAQQVVEAFRTIRLNLAHSYGVAGPVTLTVSSPGAGDGKSFVSSNLAVSFAQAGYRTLLIDGDIRRGELHRMFGVDRRPGMLDYLTGNATPEDIVRPTNQSGLWVVPCGTRRHHGPELLGSAAMSGLMGWFKSRFNVIILDSPPLGAGIDPFVLGTMTGNLVLVFRAGETDRQMAQAKLPQLERLPVRMLGAVLNEVEAGGVYRYYNYIYGYTSDEEPTAGQLPSGSSEAPSA